MSVDVMLKAMKKELGLEHTEATLPKRGWQRSKTKPHIETIRADEEKKLYMEVCERGGKMFKLPFYYIAWNAKDGTPMLMRIKKMGKRPSP